MVSFVVGEADAEQRLDRALAAVAGIPRSRARRWVDQGLVEVGRIGDRENLHHGSAKRVDVGLIHRGARIAPAACRPASQAGMVGQDI